MAEHGYDNPFAGSRSNIEGYLRGFIDLVAGHDGVWYVLDYKSNWLGNRPDDYRPAGLSTAMRDHRYPLQYLLYLVALHRYPRRSLAWVRLRPTRRRCLLPVPTGHRSGDRHGTGASTSTGQIAPASRRSDACFRGVT